MTATYNFDRKIFFNLIFFSLILNLTWGLIATQLEIIHGRDKGFISGSGFLLVYGLTFFLFIEKTRQTFERFLVLILSFIGTFLISSFLIFPIFTNLGHALIGIFASSLFSTVLIVMIVSRYFSIKYRFFTGVITFIAAVAATVIVSALIKGPEYQDLKIFQSLSILYTTWQVLTTATVALGIAIK